MARSLGGNRGSIISAETREVSRKARQVTSEARAAELPSSRRDEPARSLNERGIPTACDEAFILHPFFKCLRTLRFDFGRCHDAGD